MAFDGKLLSGVTVLIAVVEAGTIARAAEALGLSPSGVSRALSRLEQRVGAAVRAAPRHVDQLCDHPCPTSPPTSSSSMRTCGAPSVTARGYWPALPHPPPIWFQRKSAAM